jgi:tetratricopeptide (TPR) repeat protein
MDQALGSSSPQDREVLAKHRAQQSLLDRMNAALRQSVTQVAPAASPPAPREASGRGNERTDPAFVVPPQLQQPMPPRASPRPPQRQPVVYGKGNDDVDLWRLVEPGAQENTPPTGVASFEEALRRVDSSLEALVGTVQRPKVDSIAEPIIEADLDQQRPPALESDLSDPTDPAEAARLRRQRLLKRAMENLGAMPQRSSDSGLTAAPPPPTPVASSPSGLRAPPPATVAPTAAEQQLAAQVELRFEQQARKDYFTTLGLQPTATKEQVKAAFLTLAKVFHPDRLPPSLAPLAPKMSAVFEGIREAYETLYDDAKRAAWSAGQKAQAQAAQARAPANQAGDLFKMGEVFFKKRDYRQAEEHFARAFALDNKAASLAAQAWAVYMDPSRKAEAPNARTLMQRALSMDPACDRAHYQLGVIARVEGDMDRAERHFREAVRFNPRHLEANQELRLVEMRKKKGDAPSPKKGGGFFG